MRLLLFASPVASRSFLTSVWRRWALDFMRLFPGESRAPALVSARKNKPLLFVWIGAVSFGLRFGGELLRLVWALTVPLCRWLLLGRWLKQVQHIHVLSWLNMAFEKSTNAMVHWVVVVFFSAHNLPRLNVPFFSLLRIIAGYSFFSFPLQSFFTF